MATGTPKTKGNNNLKASCLYYPNKKPVAEILDYPSPKLVRVGKNTFSDNRLIFADNLGALSALAQDESVKGKVRLIYIDPPFATQSVFHSRKLAHAYEDTLGGTDFIEFLRERLIFLYQLLAHDGSLYLHLDERMVFHFRIILDEIFGPGKYRNCIIRKKCNPKNYTHKTYGNVADYILFYTKSDSYVWNRPHEQWTDERAAKEYQCVEPASGRRYKKVPIHAPGSRRGETGKVWRGMQPPPGKHWQYTPSKLDELDARGEIYWSSTGNPRRKVYFDDSLGVPLQDIWTDVSDAHNQNIRITGYPTEKNPELLRRIILASSNPDDLVLDCFSGSGTTLAVAAELGRRWIGVDNSKEAIHATLKRFATGLEPMGDFVSKKDESFQSNTLPLFGEKAGKVVDAHIPIKNYSLYAEDVHVKEMQAILGKLNWIANGVCEKAV